MSTLLTVVLASSLLVLRRTLAFKGTLLAINENDLDDSLVTPSAEEQAVLQRSCLVSHATAGESERLIGLRESDISSSESPCTSHNLANSWCVIPCLHWPCCRCFCFCFCAWCSFLVHCLLLLCHACLWMIDPCMMQGIQGVLVVCCLCANPPAATWRWVGRVPRGGGVPKGGVSGPAEDLRSASEVEPGVNFRPAGGVRRQVAGSLPSRHPGAGTRQHRVGVDTPSLHPEVPDSLFVSPGRGLDTRQSMGWTKVCGTAQSRTWVLKGNARAFLFPANLDHLQVDWMKQGTCKTAWARLSVSIQAWTWSSSQTTN